MLYFSTGTMVSAVIKMYLFGSMISVLAVFYAIVDSFGGLMYVQDHHYSRPVDVNLQAERQLSSTRHRRGASVTKNIGS